jgi:hypothetical protein
MPERENSIAMEAASPPRRRRKLRFFAKTAALLVVLVIGWAAGLKTHESVANGQASIWLRETAGGLSSDLEAWRSQIMASGERLGPHAANATVISEPVPNKVPGAEMVERVTDVRAQIDQVRVSSQSALGELGSGIERLNGTVERGQRDLTAKLNALQERLDHLERVSAASNAKKADPAPETKGRSPAGQIAAAPRGPQVSAPKAAPTPTHQQQRPQRRNSSE